MSASRDHDRPRRAAPQRADGCCARSTAPSSGPSSRPTRYGHGAVDCARGRARRGRDARSASRRSPRRSRCGAELPGARDPRARARPRTSESPRRATRGSSSSSRASEIPEGVPVHVKLDTGMGRWGVSELPSPPRERGRRDDAPRDRRHRSRLRAGAGRAVSRGDRPLSAADTPRREQRRRAAAARSRASTPSAAGSRSTACRRSAAIPPTTGSSRCSRGRPSSRSRGCCAPGESTGYGRRFVAERDTWIGILPVGYADGFRRDLTGTEVLVDGERRPRRRRRLDGRDRGRARPRAARRGHR